MMRVLGNVASLLFLLLLVITLVGGITGNPTFDGLLRLVFACVLWLVVYGAVRQMLGRGSGD